VVVDGTKRKLIIKSCDPKKDRGRYECKCGVVTTGTELLVRPALKFTKNLADTEVTEEDTIRLYVEVTKPDQKTKWIRNGRIINPNEERFARFTILSDGLTHSLEIKNVSMKDAGEFTVNVDELIDSCHLKVKECEKLPRIDASKVAKYIRVKSGKDVEVEIPYEAFPIPTVKWYKDGVLIDENRGLRKNEDNKASFKLDKALRGDKGKYECVLTNTKGEVRVPFEVEVTDKPSAPEGPLLISDITASLAKLSWKPPADIGGSDIDNYIVEKMDVARGEWQPVDTVSGLATEIRAKLTPKKTYKFRVRAVNKDGEGPNLEAEKSILAKNPYDEPTAPYVPQVLDWDADRIDIEWKAPDSDGGAPLEKYLVEKREKGKGPWVKGAEVGPNTTKTSVNQLEEGKEYEFRVIAVNKAGNSPPSECSAAQIAKARFVRPRIDKSSMKSIMVKAGQTITIECRFIAEPQPTAIWTNESNKEIADSRVTYSINEKIATFTMVQSKRSDTGKYTVKLTNDSGSDSCGCDVVVLSAPGRCVGPIQVKDVTKDSAVISWKKPEDDGGKPIDSYIVEKRDKATGVWERVADFVPGTTCTVGKLKEGHEYDFRVIPENQNGVGEPLETERPTLAKNPFGNIFIYFFQIGNKN
jgi:hypothetical protein